MAYAKYQQERIDRGVCIRCGNAEMKTKHHCNICVEKIHARNKQRFLDNPELLEKKRQKVRDWRKKNQKTYYQANKRKIVDYLIDWQKKNPDKVKAYRSLPTAIEKRRIINRNFKERNREKVRLYNREWWRNKFGYYDRRDGSYIRPERIILAYPYLVDLEADGAEILNQVNQLVPKGITEHERADICQDLVLAVLSGEIKQENLKEAVPLYIKNFKKLFNPYRHISLDNFVYDEQKVTLIDTISTEQSFDYNPPLTWKRSVKSEVVSVEDLAEKLRNHWDAERLTNYSKSTNIQTFSAKNRVIVENTNSQRSSRIPMGAKANKKYQVGYYLNGLQLKQDELDVSVSNYLDYRLEQEMHHE